jgi:hypothetical protein
MSDRLVGDYDENDTCVYTTHRNILFSIEGPSKIKPKIVAVVVVVGVGLVVLVMWLRKRNVLRMAKKRVNWHKIGE